MDVNEGSKSVKKKTRKSVKKKKEESGETEKKIRNAKKRKKSSSPEPSTSSKCDETKAPHKVLVKKSKKKVKSNSDDECDEPQDTTIVTDTSNTKEPVVVKFGMVNEERSDRFKLETLHCNLQFVAIDEICLEGLDGITLEALWTRLSVTLNYPLPFPINVMNFFWNAIVSKTDIEFYKLEEPRPRLVIYDRFKERDPDLGEIIDPIVPPLDIYPYSPVNVTNILGSASSFNTRTDISTVVRGLSVTQVEEKYGSQLVLVGSQKIRKRAICNPIADPLVEYTPMQYCLLERIARSRYLGEITQGKVSLQVMSKDPKVIFYNRKVLAENHLITKQPFNLKTPNSYHLSGTLFHIVRFYKEEKTKTITMTQQIVEYLRNKPNYRMEYFEAKKVFGHNTVLNKLFKLPEFQRFVRTDVPRFCKELYPDNSDKWLCEGSNKEKVVKTLELIDPNINVSGVWYDDDPKDESSDEETAQELMFKIPILHQVYDFIRQSGCDGRSLKEIQANKGLDFYSTRAAVNQLMNLKVITGVKIDIGRQRLMRYQTSQTHSTDLETISVESQEEKKQLELESVEFLSNLLEVEPAYITAITVEDSPKPNTSENMYAHIKKLRQQNKQNPENATELITVYKNEHGYTRVHRSDTFSCDGTGIPEHISKAIVQSCQVPPNHYARKKKLVKFYQQIKRTHEVDDLYIEGIINVQCPLVYQSLMCEESYRRLLKNSLKLSRLILSNCKYKLKELLPRKRYMCKQQLPWKELQALIETQPLPADAPSIHANLKRKPESSEELAKRLKLDEEMVTEVKEIFMGPKPTLAYESVNFDGVTVSVWVSSTPDEFTNTYVPYIRENNATLRTVKRANLILDAVKRESVITDIFRLHKAVHSQEQEEGYNVKADRKSFQRIYTRLVQKGLIKILQIILKSGKTRRVVTVLCDPSLDVRHSMIESVIEQLKMKIVIPRNVVNWTEDGRALPEAKTFNTSEITSSVGELKMLADNDCKYACNRSIGKEYGYVSKFLRMRVLHEFLFYIIYNFSVDHEVTDVDKMLQEFDILMDEDEIKEMSTVYCREIGWKMFIPPLTSHAGWPEGWALVCDILLRLPLSVFVKVCNVSLVIPDLSSYLEHPVKQHCLVKHLPSEIRSGLLHRRKYIFSVHETLCRLAYIGLLQFGPQKLREKDQVFIFLNKNASLLDTTTTSAGYHYVEDKEYKHLKYRFVTSTDVETYWYEMWNICTHSNLGMRNTVVGTYITIENLETKPAMAEALKPRTAEAALINDNGSIPGDCRGAAGLDSALWSHVKRNWNVTPQSNRGAATAQRLIKLKMLKKNKKEELKKETQNKKAPVCKKRKSVTVRKVCGNVESKHKKKVYDTIDKKLMENLKQTRSEWSYKEDLLLNICKLVSTFLCPNYRKQLVYYTVMRDTLHKLVPCSINKTSGACQRRLVVLFGSVEQQEYFQKIVKALTCIPYVKKYFQKFYDHVQNGLFLKEKQLQGGFVFLVIYFFENQHELQHIFETINNKTQIQFKSNKPKSLAAPLLSNLVFTVKKRDSEMDVLAYDGLEHISRPNKSFKLYPDVSIFPKSENDVILDTIKSIIHSTVAVRPDDISCVYQLFRVYQGYSDEMLKTAVSEVRNSQMISAKRTTKKQAEMKGLPITSKLFHFSFYYGFAQVTKFPVELFLEAHEFFLGVYSHRERLLLSSDNGLPTECFQQGHVVALSEVVTNVVAHFIVDFPKEVLILNPRIADHTELIRELAVRYKKMLTLIKDGSYFKDEQQSEGTEKPNNRIPMIQRFLKTWFLSNDKDEDDVENANVVIDTPEETNESDKKQERKRKGIVHLSSNQKILKSLNDDIHEQTATSATKRSQEKLTTVDNDTVESFEDYEKKLENLLSSKTADGGGSEPGPSTEEPTFDTNICHSNIFERYLNKGKEIKDSTETEKKDTDVAVSTENVETVEGDPAINARMASIMNEELSVEEIMNEMLDDSPLEERRVPNVIKLSRLLVKGLFPDLDEDEERLERLHQHFLVVCPDTNLMIENFENNEDLTYLYADHPSTCKNLLHRVQKDIIVNENIPTDQEIVKKCQLLEYSEFDVSTVESLVEFISKKKVLGASSRELKKHFSMITKEKLTNFLKTLIEMNVILRTGINYTLFVHCQHRKQWLVESCTLEYQDKMKLENSNTQETSDVDLPAFAKSLDSYTEMKLHVKPWARIDGTLNLKLFEKWLCTVLGHCLADMSISLTSLINNCNFLKPVDVYYLVECLQDMGCIKMNVFLNENCWLTTESTYLEPAPATIIDEFEDIFVDADKLAIIKFGTLLNKKLKEFDFPTDVAKKHGTF